MPNKRNPKSSGSRNQMVQQGKRLVSANGLDFNQVTPSDFQPPFFSSVPPTQIPKNIRNSNHWFELSHKVGTLSGSTTLDTFEAFTFQLNAIIDHTSYETIFDQYSIVSVILRFIPSVSQNATAGVDYGRLYTVIDYDDANTITLDQATSYQSLMVTSALLPQTRLIYPRVATAAYSGAFTSYANQRAWIDCGSNAVIHYGIKAVLSASTGNFQNYDVEATFVVCFRNVH